MEEGIHFQWHLYHRGRGDVKIGLVDAAGVPLDRVELPQLAGSSAVRTGRDGAAEPAGWEPERAFVWRVTVGPKTI